MKEKSPAEIAGFLKSGVGVFGAFSEARLAELVAGSRVETFAPGQAIVRWGAEAAHFGVLLEGEAEASVPAEDGSRHTFARIEAGGTFGETALMTGDRALGDVVAETRCQVLLVPVSLFQSVIVAEPSAARQVARTVADRCKRWLSDPAAAARALRSSDDPYGLELVGEEPHKILVVNCGSSSLKYAFFDTADSARLARGEVERIGLPGTRHRYRGPHGEVMRELAAQAGYDAAFEAMLAELVGSSSGVIRARDEVNVVAHRVVHGGERYPEATLVTDEVVAGIETLNPLAPLHNPVNVAGIRQMRTMFPAAVHVAVFDTAFHHTLPVHAYLYGLPYELYERGGVRRYGFHGTSHAYAGLRAAQFLARHTDELKIVSCHLGNGASLCAVDHGRSVDTSMGFTPAEGLIMGTRCGDVDPGVVLFLQRTEGRTPAQCEELLNKQSGLLGLSGISSDMREVLEAAERGHPRALVALNAYCYRVRKYLGAYVAAMGGIDAVVFTAGVGQGSDVVRALALQGLQCMGIELDAARNRAARGSERVCRISSDASKVSVLVVPSDEERMMAREALAALRRSAVTTVLATQQRTAIPVEVSAHHVHLSQPDVEALFGAGHQLTPQSDLSQPGQFACREEVALVGPKGRVDRVRVLGPARAATQVEIAMSEQFKLGVHAPVRESGDLAGTPGCTLEGPAGSVELERGVISAQRHIHMTPEDALRYGVRDKSVVRVRVAGERELVFGDVLVRVSPKFRLALHLDTDEGNAADIRAGARCYFEGIQREA